MKARLKTAAVVGSGTMGAAIAALMANAGLQVILLDIPPSSLTEEETARGLSLSDPAVRNRIVNAGLDAALKARPPAFTVPERARLVRTGNLEDDFDLLRSADWILEAVVEKLSVKQALFERIDALRAPHCVVSTNTSGIPIADLAAGRSPEFRAHFLGTHFFNPPRYLKLLEIIPGTDTLPEMVEALSRFGEERLGKGIVPCKDTPNFIGNRILSASCAFTLDYALRNGYSVEEVDLLTGPLIGRPKTATFRLLDLIGLDVMAHINANLAAAVPDDAAILPYLTSPHLAALLDGMLAKKLLGNKTRAGFYKSLTLPDGRREFHVLDLTSLEHRPAQEARFESVENAAKIKDLTQRLKTLLEGDDRGAEFVCAVLYQGFSYASLLLPGIADTPAPLDDALRWGFAHECGPFALWDALGVAETAAAMREAGYPPADWVEDMLIKGEKAFYGQEGNRRTVFSPARAVRVELPEAPGAVDLAQIKSAGGIIKENAGACLIDLGEGVACLELRTKMNTIDEAVLDMLAAALDEVEANREGLVIGGGTDPFSAGANIALMLEASRAGDWPRLDALIRRMQSLHLRLRSCPKPVVAAPSGLTLGGGLEMTLHAGRVVAASELNAGLVETGIGLIPAAGGTKEVVRRLVHPAMRTPDTLALPFLQQALRLLGSARTSASADEARTMGYLGEADRIVFNRDSLLAQAKREVLHMAASVYRPPLPEPLYAAGRDSLAALRVGIYVMHEARQISAHDRLVLEKLAFVLCGGELSAPARLDEQTFLDLEREAFLSLCGEPLTQARIEAMLKTGKPLRN